VAWFLGRKFSPILFVLSMNNEPEQETGSNTPAIAVSHFDYLCLVGNILNFWRAKIFRGALFYFYGGRRIA